ncbi:MAG: endonuclease/exonuclease/phosphatase family protein [Planctomycetota bacterium]|nr:endonuclease/exonuclease/phosphatase family protein [Planctomycetota bacterium]MEC8782313.1 endonuclease/exonuclease/phosphatase family protein [Planctomycetota bacterium]
MRVICRTALLLLFAACLITRQGMAEDGSGIKIRVMTFNLWRGGLNGGQPLDQTVKAIQIGKADIVGLQETHHDEDDSSAKIAKRLGWHHFSQGGGTAIISRFPILESTERKWGVLIQLGTHQKIYFFNVHFPASPYQPYQILKIPYGDAPFITTSEEAVEWAKKSRGRQLNSLFEELSPVLKGAMPVILTGDFNEPSFQDWTSEASEKGIVPLAVPYPTTKRIVDAGMLDAYRSAWPDELKARGYTWTNRTLPDDPKDFHDRIDFIFVKACSVTGAQIVGESKTNADLVLAPWPSDHRAVVASLEINTP